MDVAPGSRWEHRRLGSAVVVLPLLTLRLEPRPKPLLLPAEAVPGAPHVPPELDF